MMRGDPYFKMLILAAGICGGVAGFFVGAATAAGLLWAAMQGD